MKYSIAMQVRGYYIVDVEAKNVEEAKTKAENAWAEADFGELSDIEGRAYKATDESDNEHYYF